jgi:hypothetical protein
MKSILQKFRYFSGNSAEKSIFKDSKVFGNSKIGSAALSSSIIIKKRSGRFCIFEKRHLF